LIEVAARAGYQYVSLRPIAVQANEPKYPLGNDRDLFLQVRAKLKHTGVKLLDIELARVVASVSPKSYQSAFEAAAELGGLHVLSSVWTPDLSYATDFIGEMCDMAKPLGLTIQLEFMPFAEVKTLQETAAMLTAVGRDNIGICIDALHFDRSGAVPTDLDQYPQSWFHLAQLCDATGNKPFTREQLVATARTDRLFPGDGIIDIAGIVRHLPPVPFSLEIPNAKMFLEMSPVAFAKQALDKTKTYFEKRSLAE
jgi:sugar phosphate isomerase/epimerase